MFPPKKIQKPILTGILLGLSFPTYPYIHLEFFAWVAFVPLFQEIKQTNRFGEFFKKVYLALFVWVLATVWWVSTSTLYHGWSSAVIGSLLYIAQSLFSFIPFLPFFFVKKYLSFRISLWMLPFFWVGWEWIYMGLQISFPWVTLGNSQSNMIWLIQYADVLGVYGISFWVILFNVVVFEQLESYSKSKRETLCKLAKTSIAMLLPPLMYAGFVFIDLKDEPRPKIKAAIIQPNINPYEKWMLDSKALLNKYKYLIDSAFKKTPFDMAVLPETALPNYLLLPYEIPILEELKNIAASKQIALILGFADIKFYNTARNQDGDVYENRNSDFFNSSLLIPKETEPIQVYHKIKLVPFAERVPYMDVIPLLSKLTVEVAGIVSWARGEESKNFSFLTAQNEQVVLPGVICYESIYPEFIAELVQKGANMLSVITNDGWFLKTYGPYQHAAFSRLRAIENRRSLVRCANTGISFFVNEFGQVFGEKPWWQQVVSVESISINSDMSFFTKYPNCLPIICVVISVLGCIVALISYFKKKRV